MVIDDLGRTFGKLRISLTDVCNFACVYCVDEDTPAVVKDVLPAQKFVEMVKAITDEVPIGKVRLTGGEPLLYTDLVPLVDGLSAIEKINEVAMTTNAFQLERKLDDLKAAGLNSVNISIDAIDAATFQKVTRRNKAAAVLSAIDKAVNIGLDVKLNAVIVKGLNDHEVLPLVEYAMQRQVPIRFLELMDMGYLHETGASKRFSQQDLLFHISERYEVQQLERQPNETATYWQLENGYQFGTISNTSAPFCSDCNRLRLDSQGKLYGCLSSNYGIDTSAAMASSEAMQRALKTALLFKKIDKFSGTTSSMMAMGG